jgi:hypothetical protein
MFMTMHVLSYCAVFSHILYAFSLYVLFVEKQLRPGVIKFFRTQSPRHFEGGDWDQGGSCQWLQPLLAEQVVHMELAFLMCVYIKT